MGSYETSVHARMCILISFYFVGFCGNVVLSCFLIMFCIRAWYWVVCLMGC